MRPGEEEPAPSSGRYPAALVVLLVLVVSVALLAIAARGAGPLPGDLAVTQGLRGLPADGLPGLVLLYAGAVAWFLPAAVLVVALLARRWAASLCVLLTVLAAVLVGDGLKLLVGRPRPSADLVARYDAPEGYGFPSATALLIVAVLGVACYLLVRHRAPRTVVLAAAGSSAAVIAAVGLSRIYAGEHWASDVLGGWLSGGALLLVVVIALRSWSPGGTGRRATGGAAGA